MIFYLNGQFVSEDEAKISILDLGFSRGYGAFDFLRTYNGKPFKLDEHVKRLENSAKEISLQIPPISEIKQIVLETLSKNQLKMDVGIKIYATGGETLDGITPLGKTTLAVAISNLPKYPPDYYTNGVKVITIEMLRPQPQVKSTNYITAIMAKKLAREKSALEAIYKNNQGELLEATQSNFFGFKGDTLITAGKDVLMGITRAIVLEIAGREFKIDLRSIKHSETKDLTESFIASTSKEIMPVVKIDETIVGDGKVGKNTKRLMAMFKEYTL